ncbi:HCL074Cp [Eremothecium sinecaudum]|uniref:HCL074Cp n=1 Tax=Eremothecium sinecaudum TaxID=45286 RepID=A0A0X8HRF1_9SACH|nr:HCL074Cp [Eremothecium sinecaudum]AMD20077.1 HCL074Cp [Eremothecium sinecaudum]
MIGKKRKSVKLKHLRGALKDLLGNEGNSLKGNDSSRLSLRNESKAEAVTEKNGVIYIMSKESQLIPKLSDAEVLERHRRADENMRQAWAEIIKKYEGLEDQGDVVDLTTGEIVEDNGHIRNLTTEIKNDVKAGQYKSALDDILDVEPHQDSIWRDDESEGSEEEEADIEGEDEETSEEEERKQEKDHEGEDQSQITYSNPVIGLQDKTSTSVH